MSRDALKLEDAHPRSEWTEDDGDVLWWRFPIAEPPYVGRPDEDDFPGWFTHWTRFQVPQDPSVEKPFFRHDSREGCPHWIDGNGCFCSYWEEP